VNGSTANRALYHSADKDEIRTYFKSRDEAASRNKEIYGYNPLLVALV
jgi:hypothetical protein